MKFSSAFLSVCIASMALPAIAQVQGAVAVRAEAPNLRAGGGEISARATVVELDTANRMAVLRRPDGELLVVSISPEVVNLDQVRVGDQVVARIAIGMIAEMERVNNNGIRARVESGTRVSATPGEKPGMIDAKSVEVLATVQALDRKNKTATLRGARRMVTVQVPDSVDISKLKVGDMVHAKFAEATMLSVESAR